MTAEKWDLCGRKKTHSHNKNSPAGEGWELRVCYGLGTALGTWHMPSHWCSQPPCKVGTLSSVLLVRQQRCQEDEHRCTGQQGQGQNRESGRQVVTPAERGPITHLSPNMSLRPPSPARLCCDAPHVVLYARHSRTPPKDPHHDSAAISRDGSTRGACPV